MEYRFARDRMRAWWQLGVRDFNIGDAKYKLRFIVADFELRRSTTLAQLTFAAFPEDQIYKRVERFIVWSHPEPDEFVFRAPDEGGFFASVFAAETTVYGFAWVRHPLPLGGDDPLLIVVKYTTPVTVRAGDTHGIAHTIRFGPGLVLPA